MSPAAWVQQMQPARTDFTHAVRKVGFLATTAELREPLPALPATCVGSASPRVPRSGLGPCSASPAPSEAVCAGRHRHLGSPAAGTATMLDTILLSFP